MPGKGGLTRLFRPIKKDSDKKRREKVQRKRLVALGMSEEQVNALNAFQVRQVLKRPAKVKKSLAKK
jgi:hypothetical protein